jgi:hypothetical protein
MGFNYFKNPKEPLGFIKRIGKKKAVFKVIIWLFQFFEEHGYMLDPERTVIMTPKTTRSIHDKGLMQFLISTTGLSDQATTSMWVAKKPIFGLDGMKPKSSLLWVWVHFDKESLTYPVKRKNMTLVPTLPTYLPSCLKFVFLGAFMKRRGSSCCHHHWTRKKKNGTFLSFIFFVFWGGGGGFCEKKKINKVRKEEKAPFKKLTWITRWQAPSFPSLPSST